VQALARLLGKFGILLIVAGLVLSCDRIGGSAADLQVGECFDRPAETAEISDVQRQPCNEAHDAEVFLVVDHPAAEGDTYPITLTFGNFVDEQCKPAFKTYTGLDFDTATDLDLSYFYPTREGWSDGDREVTCYIARADDAKMTSSVRAATET
jgi:Septum formation